MRGRCVAYLFQVNRSKVKVMKIIWIFAVGQGYPSRSPIYNFRFKLNPSSHLHIHDFHICYIVFHTSRMHFSIAMNILLIRHYLDLAKSQRYKINVFWLLGNLAGGWAAQLPSCLPDFTAIWMFQHPISLVSAFKRPHDKMFYRILKWHPGVHQITTSCHIDFWHWLLPHCPAEAILRDHSGYGLSKWETLHCNVVSHWLSSCPEWSLHTGQMSGSYSQ